MYVHEKFIVACYQIGKSYDPPLTAVEVVAEMNHAAWEMMNQTEPFLAKRVKALEKAMPNVEVRGGANDEQGAKQ